MTWHRPSSDTSTNFVYDGQDVVKDINSDGTTVEYLNGPGIDNKIRQKGSSTSTTYYFSQDHLGSTTALTGTTGKLVERQTYDAYGNSAGSTRTRYGYTGRERDSDTGLLYYRARWNDPVLVESSEHVLTTEELMKRVGPDGLVSPFRARGTFLSFLASKKRETATL